MTRFFVEPEGFSGDILVLTEENAAHAKVLRLRIGEQVVVCNSQGREALCEVEEFSPEQTVLRVIEYRDCVTEPSVRVSVYMAFSKSDKLEHVIQKATELGAYEVVAFPSARCVSRPDEKSLAKKRDRWQKIALAAAKQSGRGIIPQVVVLDSFKDAIHQGATADLPIILYENEHSTTLGMALKNGVPKTVSLLTGPEGGLEENEVAAAAEAGFKVCTLGSRILRCETAPLCALSAVMYSAGEF